MITLQEHYRTEVMPMLKKELSITNTHATPKVTKVIISVGLSRAIKDPKLMETIEDTLIRITGQKPVKTKAKKSIASFKIREGMIVGMMVTLRGPRMWDFLSKFTRTTLPRIRDFRGISSSVVDEHGNASIGFRENLSFPEIRPDEVERVHGLQVTITTTAGTKVAGLALLKGLGFPFQS
ncbi:50S ribosomal protein L5 [Patescibacteria group bacterium]|nr:50S ribosomal protein L5 [Patescibacteria group bacterium]